MFAEAGVSQTDALVRHALGDQVLRQLAQEYFNQSAELSIVVARHAGPFDQVRCEAAHAHLRFVASGGAMETIIGNLIVTRNRKTRLNEENLSIGANS